LARELFKIELVPSALRLLGNWQFLARVVYAHQVFFPGICPFAFLRRAMRPAPASMADPVLPLMPERNELPPAEAVLFALRRIEAAFDARQRVCRSSKPCIPFPSARHNRFRFLSVAETRLKLQRIETFSELDAEWAKAVTDELLRETRKETRAPKEAPILDRLTGLVRKVLSDHDGEWTTLPSLESIAKTLRVSRRTVQMTLNRLRETSSEFAFHAEPRLDTTCADRRGRSVRVAFSSWLKHDHKPLLFDFQGKERGIRTSFRPDGEILTPGPANPAQCAEPAEGQIDEIQAAEASAGNTFFSEPALLESSTKATKCNIRLSYSVRLDEPAEFLPNLIQESHHQIGQRPSPAPPDLKGCDRNKTFRASWGLARELRRDHFGDWDEDHNPLSYHRWRFELPLFVIRDIIADAQQDGASLAKIKILFESACYETNAAVFDGLVKNAGGLFRSVFRRRCAGTGRMQSVVRQSEPLKIIREPRQIIRQTKSMESLKTVTHPEPVEAYSIDIASKLRVYRLSINSISTQNSANHFFCAKI
jgi:hypothetical protein